MRVGQGAFNLYNSTELGCTPNILSVIHPQKYANLSFRDRDLLFYFV